MKTQQNLKTLGGKGATISAQTYKRNPASRTLTAGNLLLLGLAWTLRREV